jgi:hypothetical protein
MLHAHHQWFSPFRPGARRVQQITLSDAPGSFNGWKKPFPMRRIAGSDDLVRSVLLPPGPTEFKFVTDGEWRYSPRDPVSSDQSSGTVNNCKRVQVNSSLTWRSTSSEHEIYVTGSFLAWSELVPLSYTGGGIYKAHCCLPVCFLGRKLFE